MQYVTNLLPEMNQSNWHRWWYANHCNDVTVDPGTGNEPGFEFYPWATQHMTCFKTISDIPLISGHQYYARIHTMSIDYSGTNQYSFYWPTSIQPVEPPTHASSDVALFRGVGQSSENNVWYVRSVIVTASSSSASYPVGVEFYTPMNGSNISNRYISGAMLIDLTADYYNQGLTPPGKATLDSKAYFVGQHDIATW